MLKSIFSPFSHVKRPTTLTRICRFHQFFNRMETVSGMNQTYVTPTKSPNKPPNLIGSPLEEIASRTPKDRPFRVSIEGNIGAGKSTLIQYFQNINGIETYGEPIAWWRNLNGHNLLDLMYSDIHEWLKVFQSYVQLSRLQVQTSKPQSSATTVQIFERSIQNNRFCFVEQARKSCSLSEIDFAVLDQWYWWIRKNIDIDLDLIVYLRSSPEVVFERMKARGRPEEEQVPLQYLRELHESHENWLMSEDTTNTIPVLVLDADKTLEEIVQQYQLNESKILGQDRKDRPKINADERERVKKTLQLE